jgi:hypothetical protein
MALHRLGEAPAHLGRIVRPVGGHPQGEAPWDFGAKQRRGSA